MRFICIVDNATYVNSYNGTKSFSILVKKDNIIEGDRTSLHGYPCITDNNNCSYLATGFRPLDTYYNNFESEYDIGDEVEIVRGWYTYKHAIIIDVIKYSDKINYVLQLIDYRDTIMNNVPSEDIKLVKRNLIQDRQYGLTLNNVTRSYKDFKELMKGEKMELINISKTNLKEALKQVNEEKASAEIKYAKEVLRANLDRKDTLVREIKVRQEEIDKIEEAIKLFK